MENKLTEEEVLYSLECFFGWYKNAIRTLVNEQQAYNQLVEIVKEHFKRKEFTKGHEIKQIQQKPTVMITRHDEDALFQGTKSFHEKLFILLESKGIKVVEE